MRYTRKEMVMIANDCESRSENPSYKKIMEKFDRVLNDQTKCVRLSLNEKDLIAYCYEDDESLPIRTMIKKMYN